MDALPPLPAALLEVKEKLFVTGTTVLVRLNLLSKFESITAYLHSSNLSPQLYFAVPIILILLRVVYSQAKRLIASRSSKHNKHMSYVVKWGRERLYFPLPPPDAKLAVIRKELADYTQLPYQSFKLVHAGAVMKDDNALIYLHFNLSDLFLSLLDPAYFTSLRLTPFCFYPGAPSVVKVVVANSNLYWVNPVSSYGIKENSTIAVIGTGEKLSPSSKIPSAASKATTPQRRTEETTITQIRSEMDKVRQNLQSDVDIFLDSLSASSPTSTTASALSSSATLSPSQPEPLQPSSATSGTQKKRIQPAELEHEHVRLGELLLQSLLRLDAIHSEGEWEQARKERKRAVREVQALLDRLDGAWRASRAKTVKA